jgi:GT2 family glycosyltransferase
MELVTGIILSYQNFDQTTHHALESIRQQLSQRDLTNWKFVCFDNGSSSECYGKLIDYQAQNPFFDLIRSDLNLGFAGGMNAAAKNPQSPWLMLINSDIRLPRGFLQRAERVLRSTKKNVGIVLPSSNEAGNAQYIHFDTNEPESVLEQASRIFAKETGHQLTTDRPDFCCALIRTNVWTLLDGLCLDYGLGYFEDHDFGERCKSSGFEIVISDDLFVFHAGSSSFKAHSSQSSLIQKNKEIFMRKFPSVRLVHRREQVFALINNYLLIPRVSNVLNDIENTRCAIRLETLMSLTPRSLVRKICFKFKIRNLKQEVVKRVGYL